jgi:hypothetical protein
MEIGIRHFEEGNHMIARIAKLQFLISSTKLISDRCRFQIPCTDELNEDRQKQSENGPRGGSCASSLGIPNVRAYVYLWRDGIDPDRISVSESTLHDLRYRMPSASSPFPLILGLVRMTSRLKWKVQARCLQFASFNNLFCMFRNKGSAC